MRHRFQTDWKSGERIRSTAERVRIHADSRSTKLVDQKMMHVGISLAKMLAADYADDRGKLVSGIMERAGEKQVAMRNGTAAFKTAKNALAGLGSTSKILHNRYENQLRFGTVVSM
jgi:gamma-glutamyltranspeptidase